MKIQPYYILPLLIEQPTWGGDYIARYKSIKENEVATKKIGQAYELAHESQLTTSMNSNSYFYATATSINQSKKFGDSEVVNLSELIYFNAEKVLGKTVVEKYGPKMPLLIKFTQALSNSYQVHVKSGLEFNHWLPKPESWYFFEKGKATLGLNKDFSAESYKKRCQEIHIFANQLSKDVTDQKIELNIAREKLLDFINLEHPEKFVNTIFPEAGSVIDLSQGGIHHSWETDPHLPNGNIVYEVQLDIKDEYCTLRSFDQGKMKDDGSIRDLTIDDYFKALDTNPDSNNPDVFLRPTSSYQDQNAQIQKLFETPYYTLTSIELNGSYVGKETDTTESGFHHLFVKKGSITISTKNQQFELKTGWSLFIPADTASYQLECSVPSQILKTTT